MANWGRRPITDAGKAKTNPPHLTYYFDGEERIDRRPLGRVERFVDPQGNVCSLQLGADGDPQKAMTMDRKRMEYRRDGFVEHAKCPIRHGTYLMAGVIAKDFAGMSAELKAAPCEVDPKTLTKRGHDLYAEKGCPHIEWLVEERTKKYREQMKKQNARRIAEEERELKRRKFEDLQLKKAEAEMDALVSESAPSVSAPVGRRKRGEESSE